MNKSVGFLKLWGEIMKKILLWALCMLCTTAIIPFCVGIKLRDPIQISEENAVNSTQNSISATSEATTDEEAICCTAMEYIKESTDAETKKAILSICANNYFYTKEIDKKAPVLKISTYSDSLLKELKELFGEGVYEFTYKGNKVYIPIVMVSSGHISTSDEYPYIREIASPWDTFSDNYPLENPEECGISVAGIEYLCQSSSTASEALEWYLPDFEIKI